MKDTKILANVETLLYFVRDMAEEWLTVRQAADALGRSVKWVYVLLEDNRLRYRKEEGAQYRSGWQYRIAASSVKSFRHRPRGAPGHTKSPTRATRAEKPLYGPARSGK